MGNGCAAAKEAAQRVAGRNDADGWSDAVEEYVIGPWKAAAQGGSSPAPIETGAAKA